MKMTATMVPETHDYEVILQSPDNAQTRKMAINATSSEVAQELARAKELKLVNYSLMPPPKEVWENPLGAHGEGNVIVDLSRWDVVRGRRGMGLGFAKEAASQTDYKDAIRLAKTRIDSWNGAVKLDRDGHVEGTALSRHQVARYLAHHQTAPYEVSDVRRVEAKKHDIERLVHELAALSTDKAKSKHLLQQMRDAGLPLNAVSASLYGLTSQHIIDGSAPIVWSSDTIKFSLHTSSYTPNNDNDDFFNDASNEITGTGYSAGGVTLGSKTSTYDTASDQIRLDGADAAWTSSTLTARISVEYKNTGTGSTSAVIGFINFGADVSTVSGTLTITFDATGIDVYDVT